MGLLSDPILRFRDDLAESKAVRDLLGVVDTGNAAADAITAKNKIHIDGLPAPVKGTDSLTADEMSDLRPYILLYPDESDSLKIRSEATPACLNVSGTIVIFISLPYTETEDEAGPTEVWTITAEKIDKLLYSGDPAEPGIIDYLGEAGRLQIHDIDVMLFGRTPLENRVDYGDAYDVLLQCKWGNA